MKIGIEEEFLVVDPDTLFYTPGALRLLNALVYRDINYLKKSNTELPLNSNMLERPFSDLKKAFSVVEIKTSPLEDIQDLKKELNEHRSNLVTVAEENNLILIPTGIHPIHTEKNTLPDNCASLHIHLENESEKYYSRLLGMVPFFISISTNSPFYGGRFKAMSSRALLSPHMGPPRNRFSRSSDLIINKSLNTVELRTLDVQITTDETIGLVQMLKTVAENNIFDGDVSRKKYSKERKMAIQKGRGSVIIDDEKYDLLRNSGKYAKSLLDGTNGSEWQVKTAEQNNLSSLVVSLWESFRNNKRKVKKSSIEIKEVVKWKDMTYLLPYSPFLFMEKYKKYHQDLAYLDEYKGKTEKIFVDDL